MQCVSDLGKLKDCVIGRTRVLRQVALPIAAPFSHAERRDLAFVTIELDNLIVVSLRQYAKSCLLGSRTAAGTRITTSVTPATPEEAAALVYQSLELVAYTKMNSPTTVPEKKELVIRNPKRVEKVMIDYAASNLSNFQLALSLNALVFSEVKTCRHFFSHRMRNTAEEVEKLAYDMGVVKFEGAEQFIARGRPSTGVRIIDGWLADIENFIDLAS